MLKRPLSPRFGELVLTGRKRTTIRSQPWPVARPIMLYHWSGAPYRSPQIDVAAVIVKGFWPILIKHWNDGAMTYECGRDVTTPLWQDEGFESQEDMDAWFRAVVKPGEEIVQALMRFRLAPDDCQPPTANS